MPELKEGQEAIFFLAKHPTADFYVIPGMNVALRHLHARGQEDPRRGEEGDGGAGRPDEGAEERQGRGAGRNRGRYGDEVPRFPAFGGETEQVAIPADESKLILKALAEGNWQVARFGGATNPFMAFNQLGLTEKDGWVQPIIVNVPGQPGPDYAVVMKDAFGKWLAGPGKDYVVKKVVSKATK